jgi:hypothetical protein
MADKNELKFWNPIINSSFVHRHSSIVICHSSIVIRLWSTPFNLPASINGFKLIGK